jgi:uncharacterized protein YndB with AHSA1/START domain
MSEHGTITGPGTVRFERLLPGPIERVWAYLVESDKRAQWLAAGKLPQRAGAAFELRFHHASLSPHQAPAPERFRAMEGGCSGMHEVVRCEPPHLLAITWGGGEEPSEVTFELAAEGERVRLVLTHRRLADRKQMVNVAGGWHSHLAILEERLAGRTPPAFWPLFEGIEADYAERFGAEP